MKKILFVIYVLLITNSIFSQNITGTLTGSILEHNSDIPLPYANIVIVNNDLVKVEMNHEGKEFLNYKATFTILDIKSVSRRWIDDIMNGNIITENTPQSFKLWREKGVYTPLKPKG